jgi:prephenate dehydrogenase
MVIGLLANHKVILTPLPTSADWAVEKLIQLWSAAKAEVICMDVTKHDEVLAHTSHLPHLMAFNLVEQLANREDNLDIFRYAAGGFRDFSRIAAGVPTVISMPAMISHAMEGLLEKLPESVLRQYEKEIVEFIQTPTVSSMFVTPKNIDELIGRVSFTISEAINRFLT